MKRITLIALLFAVTKTAAAQDVAPIAQEPPAQPSPLDKKKRYTLPFALRPAVAPDLVRIDSAFAFQDRATATATTVTGGFRPWAADLGFYGRLGVVQNAPDGAKNAGAVSNPLLFALFTPEIAKGVRLSFFGGVTVPVGMGGGAVGTNDAVRSGVGAGIYARQAMDNALFATNYTTTAGGLGAAWMRSGFTLQAETTLLYSVRVRGEEVDKEPARTNFTTGLHAGYLIANLVNVGVEGHYQHWISTPAAVTRDDSARNQATVGGGARINIPLSESILARPGIAYFHPVDDPMAKNGYRIVQLDVPVAF